MPIEQAEERTQRTADAAAATTVEREEMLFLPLSPKLAGVGPSHAHELEEDPEGIGFAVGPLYPGTLYAKGQVQPEHTLHFSIGRAGSYKLYVGLRYQAALLPGCPFSLLVLPGVPSARHTFVELHEGVILESEAGSLSRSVRVVTCDALGNRCVRGGGALVVSSPSPDVETQLIDRGDGTYTFAWLATRSGRHRLHVSLNGHEVLRSPVHVRVSAAPPDVAHFQLTGEGLQAANAGEPVHLCIRCFDAFGNRLRPPHGWPLSQTNAVFGIAIVDSGKGSSSCSSGSSSSSMKGRAAAKANGMTKLPRESQEIVTLQEQQQQQQQQLVPRQPHVPQRAGHCGVLAGLRLGFDSILDSMPFEGSWLEADEYSLALVAERAGEFELHVWVELTGRGGGRAAREQLPGSPLALNVQPCRPSAATSIICAAEPLKSGTLTMAAGPADISFRVQLRDEYGNTTPADERALHALSIVAHAPDAERPLAVTPVSGVLGECLVSYQPALHPMLVGKYRIAIMLGHEFLGESPLVFAVTPGPADAPNCVISMPSRAPIYDPYSNNRPYSATLTAFDQFGNRLCRGGANAMARVQQVEKNGETTGIPLSANVEDCKDGSYRFTFTWHRVSLVLLQVRIENRDLEPQHIDFFDPLAQMAQRARAESLPPEQEEEDGEGRGDDEEEEAYYSSSPRLQLT